MDDTQIRFLVTDYTDLTDRGKMKITIINGTAHKGSTYHIARMIADKTGGQITEFFLPKDFNQFCCGCINCFNISEKKCPHYEQLAPITNAMVESDVLIFESPVYAYHATGAMKVLLDHYAYQWMVHSPEPSMFKKQAVCVSTAAGAGMKSTIKDMADSLWFWGVPKIYKFGLGVAAVNWDGISAKKKKTIEKKTSSIARKLVSRNGKVRPGIKTKAFFFMMHLLQKNGWNPRDAKHWKEHGWTGKSRPWK